LNVMGDPSLREISFQIASNRQLSAESSVFQHDSFSRGQYGIDNSFPTTRVGFEHVGSVFINNKMRQSDVDV
jgi:hypothetical protein